jgi:rod shape-determining protein MreD
MILPRGQPLLLPVNPWFILASLLAGLMINMLQNIGLFGHDPWVPDVLAVILVFWCVHQPLRVGVFWGFGLGLVSDVHQGALLGQHALSFSVMGYLASHLHRRMQWFTGISQAPQILPVFVVGSLVEVAMRFLMDRHLPGWGIVLAPLLDAALWVPLSHVLLMPQRRPLDPDKTRPL